MSRIYPKQLLCVTVLLAGCYEIPPEIPEGYIGGGAAPGWPPVAVYHRDPFHPSNLLYHRLFILNRQGGQGHEGEDSRAVGQNFDRVDHAEITALAHRLIETLEISNDPENSVGTNSQHAQQHTHREDALTRDGLQLLKRDLRSTRELLRDRGEEGDLVVANILDDILKDFPKLQDIRDGPVDVELEVTGDS